MPYPNGEWVANRVAALHAWINEAPDANAWLQATGLDKNHLRRESDQMIPCNCPYCQNRKLERKGDLV